MRKVFLGLIVVGLALSGCHAIASSGDGSDGHRGRYAGIGLYSADKAWAHIAGAPQPTDKAMATTADDTMVIVTVDGVTGELRQCGNYSGHCVGMNPWRATLGAKQAVPVSLTARDEAAVENVAITMEPAGNEAAPAKK